MLDFSWTEIGVIFFVAVVALGPEELPKAMRAFGRFTRQARKLAAEFQGHVNEVIREAELEEVRTTVQKVTQANVSAEIGKLLDPGGDFAEELARTEQEMQTALANQPPPVAVPAPAEAEAHVGTAPPAVAPTHPSVPAPTPSTHTPPHEGAS